MKTLIDMLNAEDENHAIEIVKDLLEKTKYVFALFPNKKVYINSDITLGQMLALFEVSDGMRKDIGEIKLLNKGQA